MKSLIYGVSEMAELLLYQLKKYDLEMPEAFVVERDYKTEDTFQGRPVVCLDELDQKYSPSDYGLYVCIGYNQMNQIRRRICTELIARNYTLLNFIHPTASVNCSKMGQGNLIFEGVVLDCFSCIGDGNIFYINALLENHSVAGNYNFFGAEATVGAFEEIGDGCFFGMHSSTLSKLHIGDYTLIGANAVVTKDTEKESVIVPVRSIVLENKKSTEMNLI
jgi:acetyltransferase-like isoleucine patch superfamily enzyme